MEDNTEPSFIRGIFPLGILEVITITIGAFAVIDGLLSFAIAVKMNLPMDVA